MQKIKERTTQQIKVKKRPKTPLAARPTTARGVWAAHSYRRDTRMEGGEDKMERYAEDEMQI